VVVGRRTVGKPVAALLLARNAPHHLPFTHEDLPGTCSRADVRAAVGVPEQPATAPPGASIDAGDEWDRCRFKGDASTRRRLGVAGAITPVPGGVGPMTIAMLMSNTLAAARAR
jgi:methylenetetrahydrofolate dehydrogenase (NADP+)/methenyltetrahydrofolate cyclohydrolase